MRPRPLTGRPGLVVATWFLAVLIIGPGALRLTSDNSPRVFFPRNAPALQAHDELLRNFATGESVRVLAWGADLWTRDGLDLWRAVEAKLASAPQIRQRVSPIELLGSNAASSPAETRRRMKASTLHRELGLIDAEGESVGALIEFVPMPPSEVIDAVASIERSVASILESRVADSDGSDRSEPSDETLRNSGQSVGLDLTVQVVGLAVLNDALNRSSREIGARFFPLLILLATALLALAFRGVRSVVVPLVFVGLVEALTLGTMGWLGVRLNLVLSVLPPLIFVIGLATAVHVLVRLRESGRSDPVAAVRATFDDKGWAVLWTGITTIIGFASLTVSSLAPVRAFGLWAAIGITINSLAAFTLLPALLILCTRRSAEPSPTGARAESKPRIRRFESGSFERLVGRRGRIWAAWSVRNRRGVLGVAFLLATLALLGLPKLRLATNGLEFLAPSHPVRQSIEAVQNRGIGLATIELALTQRTIAPDESAVRSDVDRLDTVEALRRQEDLATALRELPGVIGVVGAGDLLAAASERAAALAASLPGASIGASADSSIEAETDALALAGLRADPDSARALRTWLHDDGDKARITLFVPVAGDDVITPLVARAEALGRENFPGTRVEATGEVVLLTGSQRQLLNTLIGSLSLTLLVVGVILRLLLPSTRLTILALVPNLWPVAGALGAMAWLGGPLDVATVMVSSVVLGLAVDDTIHTLGHFRRKAARLGCYEAVAETLEHTAPAYIVTGAILAMGFGVCALSDFGPTARFGALSAGAIVLAVVGDLFLLPALLGSTPDSVVTRLGIEDETARPG